MAARAGVPPLLPPPARRWGEGGGLIEALINSCSCIAPAGPTQQVDADTDAFKIALSYNLAIYELN